MNMVQLALDVADVGCDDTHLKLCFDVDLVIEIGLEAVFARLSILAYEDKN